MKRKMKKLISATLVLVLLVGILAGCGGSKDSNQSTGTAKPDTAASQDSNVGDTKDSQESKTEGSGSKEGKTDAGGEFDTKYNWSFSSVYATGTVIVDTYKKFAELANEYTNGAVTITVYPDGTIAGEEDSMSQVSSGELEFCGTGTGPFWSYTPEYAWIMAPFMIETKEAYFKVYDSEPMKAVRQSWADKNGVRDLAGCFYRGMRTLVSKREVRNADDLKDLKLRMNASALWNAAWQAMGCTTVTIPLSELYTSVQSGVVEACENPLSESGSLNIPEVVKYVIPTNHVVESSIILMSNSLYESLPAHYQEALVKAGKDAFAWGEKLIAEEEAKWLQAYKDAGAEVLEFDYASAKNACKEFWKKTFETEWTGMTYDEVMALIEESHK